MNNNNISGETIIEIGISAQCTYACYKKRFFYFALVLISRFIKLKKIFYRRE